VFGSATLTEEDILDFARRFDTQSFHTDPVAAQAGPFQGLIASGWHTTAVMMRMYADQEVLNQHGETVQTTTILNMLRRRP